MAGIEGALAWLASLPQGLLLAVMAALAAVENIFPPIPADVLVAFGAFLAARGGSSAVPAFLAVWIGNLVGAAAMYGLGHRYGAERIEQRYHLDPSGGADRRLLAGYEKYGTFALFLSRFVPGVRAVIPPVAGALRLPFGRTMAAMGAASGIWYGGVTVLAWRAGNNWDALKGAIGRMGMWSAVIAVALVAVGAGLAWRTWRRGRA